MNKQKKEEEEYILQLKLEKLPFKLKEENFKILGNAVSLVFHEIYKIKLKAINLKWVFSTVKRFKIFLEIFYANEKGEKFTKKRLQKKFLNTHIKQYLKLLMMDMQKEFMYL